MINYELMDWIFSLPNAFNEDKQYYLDQTLVYTLRGTGMVDDIDFIVSDEMISKLIDLGANPNVDMSQYKVGVSSHTGMRLLCIYHMVVSCGGYFLILKVIP